MGKKYIAKRYWVNKETPMSEVDKLSRQYSDVINLSLGDPDLITNTGIINKAFEDALAGHTKYTDYQGDPELIDEIIKFYKKTYDISLDYSEVLIMASGCLGMYLALEAIVDDGDEVIMQAPFFSPYPQQVEMARGIPIELATYEEEDFQINIDRLESLINERTKAIVINSPSNPTGNCLTIDTMNDLAKIAKKYDLIVIADDIYTAFSYQHPFVPFMSIEGMRERTITINSFSKNYTMTGWRIGNIIAPPELLKTMELINENLVFVAPSISQRAAIYALQHTDTIQPPMVNEYKQRVYYAAERVNGIKNMSVIYPPKGTFYLFVNIKETGLSSVEASRRILEEAHVLTIPGIAFGNCGEGYIRIACTVKVDVLKEAFDRISVMPMFS